MAKIVVDSGCPYASGLKNKMGYNVELVPLNMQIGEKHFVDDENLDLSEYIKAMSESDAIPKTSAPSPERYMEAYKGDESVFVITLSSKLSGSHNSAQVAKGMYLDENPTKFIHVFDSLSACSAETVMAMKLKELIDQKLPDLDIVDKMNKFISETETIFILEKYDNLVKTGRMNPLAAKIASMLSIRAICRAVDGQPAFFDKARGFNKALTKLIDEMTSQNKDFTSMNLGIMHVRNEERAMTVKEAISKKMKFKQIVVTEATGICTTYGMQNGIVVAY